MREEGRGVWFFADTTRMFEVGRVPFVANATPVSVRCCSFLSPQHGPHRVGTVLRGLVICKPPGATSSPPSLADDARGDGDEDARDGSALCRSLAALVLSNAMTATPQTHKHIRRMSLLCCLCTCAGSGSRIAHSLARRTHVRRRRRHVLAEPMSDEGHRATFAELMSKDGLRPLGE